MRCRACDSDNPADVRFCGNCGTALSALCPSCGAENPPGFNFCGQCGHKIAAPQPPPPEEATRRSAGSVGERRHLTVLFSDLVDSTAIAARLDPEEWREIVAGYHRAAGEAIGRFGGHVAKYLGDGVMAYFGWPEAHDNDAERAARAGLAILDALAALNQAPNDPKLSARVGIDSGTVVIGAGAAKDADVFGDAPNIAARVQAAAEPDSVLITEAVHRLVSGLFIVEERGAHALKGVERPIPLYRIVRPSGMRGRFKAAAARGLTPFVGREDELRLLMGRWKRVLDGEGQTALITGEAGIGKSRLLHRFHEEIATTSHTWIEAGAAAFFQNTPFYPIADALGQMTWHHSLDRLEAYLREQQTDGQNSRSREADPGAERLDELRSELERAGLNAAEAIPLLAPLLNLPVPANYAPSQLPPERQRRKLLAALIELVLASTRSQPLALVIEDLHWADPSTLELIQLLVEQGAAARLMLLLTARPEFHPPWPLAGHHVQITLSRLGAADVRAMIEQVAARKALPHEIRAAVIERTGGVPLFVEELTQAVLERGDDGAHREIPATLHDSLMARLDRLGPFKEIIQIGAVLGGEFSYELLHAVHRIDHQELERALRAASEAELLYARGLIPDATYQFKHALIRDAAYEALLKSRRRELHRRVAETIDQQFPALKEAHPEVLARHWTEGGETERAILEWIKAGKAAEARVALGEAQEAYQQALSSVRNLPASTERDLRELELRQSIVRVLQIRKGYSAPETIDANRQAAALAEKSGNLAQLVTWTIASCNAAIAAGEIAAATSFADQALEIALREGSRATLGQAHALQIIANYWAGHFTKVERHFAEGAAAFEDPALKQFPGVALGAFGFAAWNAWTRGQADVARRRVASMMTVADPNSLFDIAFSRTYAANVHVFRREYKEAEELSAQSLEIAEGLQLPMLAAIALCCLGYARAELGRASEGAGLIQRGIDLWGEIGMGVGGAYVTAYLASSQAREGSVVEAMETIERALTINPAQLAHRPEAFRVRGELRLQVKQLTLAEADFRDSIALAQRTGAKAWELRSATSLARLLLSQGRRDEARAMLAEIYNWFTEGLDTADLKDAKALLDELNR